MKSSEVYQVVYSVVNRVLKSESPARGCEKMFAFVSIIPGPKLITESQAEALCASVSASTCESGLGLECFFQFYVYLTEFRSNVRLGAATIESELKFRLLADDQKKRVDAQLDPPGMEKFTPCVKLGEFVRAFHDSRKVTSEADCNELNKIKDDSRFDDLLEDLGLGDLG